MNKILWKLDHISERLWLLATMIATQAAALTDEGKGMAIVADETRLYAEKVSQAVEKAVVEGEALNKDTILPLAWELNLLALNNAIESSRLGHRGKQAAIYADEIRNLAREIIRLFEEDKKSTISRPWPANVLSSVSQSCEFLQFTIDGISFYELLSNIKEICCYLKPKDGNIILRSMEIPFIDGFKQIGKTQDHTTYVILQTPWAEQNKLYAVAAEVNGIYHLPIGKPINAPTDMPLADYVRECWENENGEPFYFMNWTKMASMGRGMAPPHGL